MSAKRSVCGTREDLGQLGVTDRSIVTDLEERTTRELTRVSNDQLG